MQPSEQLPEPWFVQSSEQPCGPRLGPSPGQAGGPPADRAFVQPAKARRRRLFFPVGAVVAPWVLVAAGCGGDPALRRGEDALGQGRYAEAVAALEDARTRLPPAEQPIAALASAHRALAAEALAAADCDRARAHLTTAEGLDGVVLLVDHRALYDCVLARDPPPEVRVAGLEELIGLGDGRIELRHTLMRLYLDVGRDADAIALVPTLERAYGLTLDDHRVLVGAWERTGQPAAARPHVLKLLQADPRDLLARLKLAELDEAGGDLAAAEQAYRALVVDHPQNPVLFMRLAQYLERRGQAAEARALYRHTNTLRGIANEVEAKRPLKKSRR